MRPNSPKGTRTCRNTGKNALESIPKCDVFVLFFRIFKPKNNKICRGRDVERVFVSDFLFFYVLISMQKLLSVVFWAGFKDDAKERLPVIEIIFSFFSVFLSFCALVCVFCLPVRHSRQGHGPEFPRWELQKALRLGPNGYYKNSIFLLFLYYTPVPKGNVRVTA